MADILIRGMEMPKDGRITIQIGSDGAVYFVEKCRIMAEKYEKNSHVIPLPEGHGRLGDLDELIASFRESVQECKKISEDGYADALQEVNERAILATFIEAILRTKAQPTIIEAEGGGEDD